MRLIDADALQDVLYHEAFETDSDMQRWDSGCWIRYKMFENAIDNAPTIEPKQGEWIYCEDDEGQDGYRCSECGFFVPWYYGYEDINFIYKYHICPSCMTRMKGTDDDY